MMALDVEPLADSVRCYANGNMTAGDGRVIA